MGCIAQCESWSDAVNFTIWQQWHILPAGGDATFRRQRKWQYATYKLRAAADMKHKHEEVRTMLGVRPFQTKKWQRLL